MRTPTVNAALEKTLTRERLGKYLAASGADLDKALVLYEENTRLSEAFYSPLQCVEICLRNHLQAQLNDAYGGDWFENGLPGFTPVSRSILADAIRELGTEEKPINEANIVAELKFAFWVGLLGPHYDASLWRKSLYRAFRGGARPRKQIHGRFNFIRRFRNRIMHHEPIFDRPLIQHHDEIIEAIGWMCRDTAAWAAHHSRFLAVHVTIERPGQS